MRAPRLAALLALAALLLGCAGRGVRKGERCADRGYPRSRGLYAVVPLDAAVSEALLKDPLVDGLVVQLSWRRIQPTAQWAPDWRPLDAILAQARLYNKRVALRVEAGVYAPDWVYAAGSRALRFRWEEENSFGLCAKVRAPLSWDPVHLGAFNALLWSAGQRYNQNTALTHVQLTGIGALPGRLAMPLSRDVPLSNWKVSCRTADNVKELYGAGYTRARLVDAWEDVLKSFRGAFPNHQLAVTVGGRGFPGPEDRPADASKADRAEAPVEPELKERALLPGPSRVVLLLEGGVDFPTPELSPVGVRLRGDESDMRVAILGTEAGKRAQFFEVSADLLQRQRLRPLLAKLRSLVRERPAR